MMRYWIAMDGGATHVVGGLFDEHGQCLVEGEGPACNPTAYGLDASLAALVRTARSLLEAHPVSASLHIVAAVAGIDLDRHGHAMAKGLCQALGAEEVRISGDLQPILLANAPAQPAILVVAGTGSNVLAQDGSGQLLQVGGHGAVLSDDGSAYRIAIDALRAACDAVDGLGPNTHLVETLPAAVGLGDFLDLVAWTATAGKGDVAGLCRTVAETADKGDGVALRRIESHGHRLAAHVQVACRRLHLAAGTPLFLHGGLFRNCPRFKEVFCDSVERLLGLTPTAPGFSGHEAVYQLHRLSAPPPWLIVYRPGAGEVTAGAAGPGATEGVDLDGAVLDSLDAPGLFSALLAAERGTLPAIESQGPAIVCAMNCLAETLEKGGRVFYIGAGTSGRLGVLDASECPPTFGVEPTRFTACIAGGEVALRHSVEGAEDDRAQGRADLEEAGVGPGDAVVGIAASGATPYTRAALDFAKSLGARTILLCCNPVVDGADIVIACPTGPEALPGSTRLKAGTATKIVLNMLSTGALTLTGHVFEGRMVGMKPINEKLHKRAVRMIEALASCSEAVAEEGLRLCAGNIRQAILMLRTGCDVETAALRLEKAQGRLDRALVEGDGAPKT